MISIPIWVFVLLITLAIILILLFTVPFIYYKIKTANQVREILSRVNEQYTQKR